MSFNMAKIARLELNLAGLLYYGTWIASAAVGLGLAVEFICWHGGAAGPSDLHGVSIVTAGIALFIMLPVLRIIVMLFFFALARDYVLSAIAAIVLTIIVLGCAVGLYMPAMTT